MNVYIMLIIAWGAGLMAVFGGFLAHVEGKANTTVKKEFVHGVTAFGGGILLAAVAFALVPEGMKELNAWQLTGLFAAGGVTFCFVDAWLQCTTGKNGTALDADSRSRIRFYYWHAE
ncbi:hypothetical protein [Idiomarina loihiensis]|uniref:hypothetical protein n=1 Tax=Idiomarina loihiensis TaxID=135577 RepID=UPI00384F1336